METKPISDHGLIGKRLKQLIELKKTFGVEILDNNQKFLFIGILNADKCQILGDSIEICLINLKEIKNYTWHNDAKTNLTNNGIESIALTPAVSCPEIENLRALADHIKAKAVKIPPTDKVALYLQETAAKTKPPHDIISHINNCPVCRTLMNDLYECRYSDNPIKVLDGIYEEIFWIVSTAADPGAVCLDCGSMDNISCYQVLLESANDITRPSRIITPDTLDWKDVEEMLSYRFEKTVCLGCFKKNLKRS